ncbi:MAG: hypothetical protein SOW36_00685 [Porphyromonas sp.]|nr:hypothetical protein [Porphyromonas sp.]MDY3111144.1 hypothetical protein [Porphyromonas sp.]
MELLQMHPSPHTKQLAIALLTALCYETLMSKHWDGTSLITDV